ncbi:MAG: replication factor C large subunit [Candidatus Woesearchaeota archaeon]
MIPWTEKYMPKAVKEVLGQDSAVQSLRDFVANFKKQKKRSLLVYGPSGVGKTAVVHALAKELGQEILEVNASDVRNSDEITAVLGGALKQQSLFFRGKILLVDEIDGVSGMQDRGGLQTLAKLIDDSAFPIVLTANNPWESKFNALRSKSILVSFQPLNYMTIFTILKSICKAEGIKADETALKTLSRRSNGDARAAINDLQSLSERTKELTQEKVDELSDRNRTETMMQALMIIFKTTQAEIARHALDNVDEDLDTSFLWIDANLPKEYTKRQDLARAYESLSKADIFRGRIRRWQHWDFLVYVNTLLTVGISVAKDEKYHSLVSYSPTTRILKIWQANMRFQKRKAIAEKVAEFTHSSRKEVLKSTIPYMKVIFKKNKAMAKEISESLDLNQEEVEWLRS